MHTIHAAVGDRIVVRGRQLGEPARRAVVLEVRGDDGGPPYLVQWTDSDHGVLFFPGNDAEVESAQSRGGLR